VSQQNSSEKDARIIFFNVINTLCKLNFFSQRKKAEITHQDFQGIDA